MPSPPPGRSAGNRKSTPGTKPISVADVGAALESIPREPAGRRLIELASRSMVYTYDIMDGDRAKKLTEELVTLLGEDAEWFSNQDPGGETSWSPVTRCTFDGVVAATAATHFAILLQLGED